MDFELIVVILSIILYSLAFYNCYHLLCARQSPAASISWIWGHLTLPIIAVPLYWLLSEKRLQNYPEYQFHAQPQKVSDIKRILHSKLSNEVKEEALVFQQIFSRFGKVFEGHSCDLNLLVDGSSTFSSIFSAISSAQSYILVQYYILRSDSLGLELKKLLMLKASQGIKIFLLYDNMGSFWLSRHYIKDLRKAGVKTATFLPIFSVKRFYLLNFRNHRKIVAVDGKSAFTGGLNVGEEYASSRFGKKTYWRDTHIKVEGPCVKQLEAIFFRDWQYATGNKISIEALNLAHHQKKEKSGRNNSKKPAQTSINQYVQLIPSGPQDSTQIGMLLFMQLIHSAKKRLWVSTPYFVPDETLQRSLELAVLRGVDVRILIPRHSAQSLVHWVTLSYAEQMQRKGVKIFLYEKGFIHQKVFLHDDGLSLVGTNNFDNRTLYLNFELMLAIFGKEFNLDLEKMLIHDFKEASEFSPRKDRYVRRLVQLRANGARLLAPLL